MYFKDNEDCFRVRDQIVSQPKGLQLHLRYTELVVLLLHDYGRTCSVLHRATLRSLPFTLRLRRHTELSVTLVRPVFSQDDQVWEMS